ncbi:hypothetical protein PVW46_16950 [Mameliella sp. AT18]|uniref:hypothetical protein n=1 Tax=Mameliella sp. AT18 TaxID=3028385 RepID=UPI0008411885|nr:hypothetical protein [Mameliella sp. AT18]MDD9731594.1 hypothetical protein [Mameliella sp. AT18]ODM45333.1 hypothetical protein A9320_27880 [Ruegeria sp. PBVC088]
MTPRARFVICAAALAANRGGMSWDSHLLSPLASACEALPGLPAGDALGPVRGACEALLAARLAGDAFAYGQAKDALQLRLAAYWALKVREVAA